MLAYLFMALTFSSVLNCFKAEQKPAYTIYTPDSILQRKDKFHFLYIGNRTRYSTCTGTVWFKNNNLAVLNLFGNKINIYAFNHREQRFSMVQEISDRHDSQLLYPENLAISPDERLLAVCCDGPFAGVHFYALENGKIVAPSLYYLRTRNLTHNVKFTSDGRFLGIVGWDRENSICVYKITHTPEKFGLDLVCKKQNPHQDLVVKGIAFTKAMDFVVICYAGKATRNLNQLKYLITSYHFDPNSGLIGEEISTIKSSKPRCTEDMTFIDNDSAILVSDQAHDEIIKYDFNQDGILGTTATVVLKNPLAQLNFPHGFGISSDDTMLAVTNYGDDKVTLYRLTP